jgi:tripartite-type tricarboxylate transporter receptor subunit TctC
MTRWCVAALAAAFSAAALAQGGYPAKPIRMLVGFPPGGGLDFTTRLIAPPMAELLGQPIVIENKAGAAGVLAMTEIARSAPDGYTLIVGNIGPLALAPNMMAKPPYDPVKDFTAIGQIVATYFVAAVPVSLPAGSLREFFDWAKANEGKVNCASGGNASITHMNCVLLNQVGGIGATHVPYKGTAPAVADLIAGQTHILIDILSVLGPQVKGGKLKALAVAMPAREPEFPNVPTMREAGYAPLETSGWQGLVGPAGLPRPVVERLADALAKTLARPDVRERFAKAGTPVVERGPDEFAAFIRSENERWLPIIRASGAKIE